MLYPRVEHQAVLAVVVVVVGPLVVHPYHPFRDAVRLLRQPAVFIVAVDIVRIFRDAVTNTNAEGESAAVDVQLVYLTDDSKLLAADYDQIASTPLPDVLGKNYIDHQDFNLLPDTIKTLPPVKLDEKTQFIGVVAYFSDDQATEWKQIETVEGTGHHYRLLVHVRQSSIEMKKEDE